MKAKIKHRICGWISVIGLVVTYVAAAAIDCDIVSLSIGTLIMFAGVAVFILAAHMGRYMKR